MKRSYTLNGIAIQLGLLCPLKCDHCYVSAGPNRKERLNLNSIQKIVEGYGKLDCCSRILVLTGGEPFAIQPELSFAVDLANHYALDAYINTSGFFGRSVHSALKTLQKYKTIARLEISIDTEHQGHLPLEYPLNTAAAAHVLGIPVQFAVQQDEWDRNFSLRKRLETMEWASVYKQTYAPVGDRNIHGNRKIMFPSFIHGGCGKVGNLLFDENGYAYPCTSAVAMAMRNSFQGEPLPGFTLGSIHMDSFNDIIQRLYSESRIELLATIGPSNAARLVEGMKSCDRDTTYCHTCIRIHENGSLWQGEEKLINLLKVAQTL
jgi:organic radical activating enzyme